jgi:hypothetical protein
MIVVKRHIWRQSFDDTRETEEHFFETFCLLAAWAFLHGPNTNGSSVLKFARLI